MVVASQNFRPQFGLGRPPVVPLPNQPLPRAGV